MGQALTAGIASAPIAPSRGDDDSLGAMRGIIRASIASLVFFWLPLALAWRW